MSGTSPIVRHLGWLVSRLRKAHAAQRHPLRGAAPIRIALGATLAGALLAGSFLLDVAVLRDSRSADAALLQKASHSTTIALDNSETRVWVVNREANSVSIIQVRVGNQDVATKQAEVHVGREPRCVAVHPNNNEGYVVNALGSNEAPGPKGAGTVSVVSRLRKEVVATIPLGTEPRGCALSPSGKLLYVANHTQGTVSIVDTQARAVVGTVNLGGNPAAVLVTNDRNGGDADERVFVTQLYAELIPGGPGEMRDQGKRGVVFTFPVSDPTAITKITLSPLADSGFNSNRSNFCQSTHPAHALTPIFCPRPDLPATAAENTSASQGVYPNQLLSAFVSGSRLFLPNIGAQPEPPEAAETNVQALVHVVDANTLTENAAETVNLNVQINTEPAAADPKTSLARVFGNDIVAIDGDAAGKVFLIASRGGNYILRATLGAGGKLDIGAPNNVVRFKTGNLPSGVTVRKDGKRAYASNDANFSMTAMNLETNTVIAQDISSSEPPAPGTVEHATLVGKIAFFTALGIPDNGIFDTPIRDFDPLFFRGKQSKSGWSSCGSCHPDGLADGVTWSFGTGPRQTKPLDGMFDHGINTAQGILNWSAVRGSNTDFNANSRATQGGCGFASAVIAGVDPPAGCISATPNATAANPAIYDHGITHGGSDALDAQTLWIFNKVRPLNQPQPSTPAQVASFNAGKDVFAANCATCHGGAKWSKSEIFHRDDPAVPAQNQAPFDAGVLRLPVTQPPGVTVGATLLNELKSFTCDSLTFNYLDPIGTFDVNEPKEIRDNGPASTAFGVNGFNTPSLVSTNYHAPYLHRGQAQTLPEVFPLHELGASPNTIATVLSPQQQSDLLAFLKAIDGTTDHLRSAGDDFRDSVRTQVPPCP
jgi:YVTN family beta-propeller protein